MKTTNHLTPTTFYNAFLDYLVLLEPFHSDDITPPMSANQFYWNARIQFSTGSRVSEILNAVKSDFDFDNRIFTIRNPKTGLIMILMLTLLYTTYVFGFLDFGLNQFPLFDNINSIEGST